MIVAARLLGFEKSQNEVLVKPFTALLNELPSDEEFQMMTREDLIILCQLQANWAIDYPTSKKKHARLQTNRYYAMGQADYVRAVIVGGVRASDIEEAKEWHSNWADNGEWGDGEGQVV